VVFCRVGDGGNCHQLLRPADIARSDLSDRADDSAQQSAVLMAAVCVSDSVCPVVCGRRPVAGCPGHPQRFPPDHAVVVSGLRTARAGHELRIFARCPLPAGDGRRGSISGSDPSGGGMGSTQPAIDSDGDHQCGDGGGVGAGSAADRPGADDEQLEDGVSSLRAQRGWHG
jgi:hypothetical protein